MMNIGADRSAIVSPFVHCKASHEPIARTCRPPHRLAILFAYRCRSPVMPSHEERIMVRKVVVTSLAALSLSMLVVVPAWADEPAADTPDTAGGRYTLNKVTDGFVRLDTKTGEVALCSQRAVGWACQAAPEDRAAFESEIARLRGENAALKQSLLSHGLPLPSGATAERPGTHDNEITI